MSNLAWYATIMTQIITESLPISSSGHVALLCMIFGVTPYDFVSVQSENASWLTQQLMARSVDHFLHGPTLIIVAIFFYRRWMTLLTGWRKTLPIIYRLICYVGIADFITGLCFIGLRLAPLHSFPLGLGFAITALALASLSYVKKSGESLTIYKMIILGLVQGCALLPGISRFASTYAAARWLSLSPRHALEASWMIQVPLMGISFLYSLIIFWQKGIPDQVLNMGTAFVMMGASIGGWYALRFAAYVSTRKKMWWFACYMVVPFIIWVLYK
jgi:undecaprenyl-diphosphatase